MQTGGTVPMESRTTSLECGTRRRRRIGSDCAYFRRDLWMIRAERPLRIHAPREYPFRLNGRNNCELLNFLMRFSAINGYIVANAWPFNIGAQVA